MQLERGQETLRQENAALHDRTTRDWFMIGAGVYGRRYPAGSDPAAHSPTQALQLG